LIALIEEDFAVELVMNFVVAAGVKEPCWSDSFVKHWVGQMWEVEEGENVP
jgi:hypothetical protein